MSINNFKSIAIPKDVAVLNTIQIIVRPWNLWSKIQIKNAKNNKNPFMSPKVQAINVMEMEIICKNSVLISINNEMEKRVVSKSNIKKA
ncbi:MAG: hypothetical protein HUK24_04715 [Sphaerochaetaceae bacterium]|nr:hypothetical protein [Sphaerochaetaceae bacterium]